MSKFKTLPQLLKFVKNEYNVPTMFNDKKHNSWVHYSTKDFYNTIVEISLGLNSIGVKKGDCIALISNSNTKWIMLDLAIMINGAITVPMFPNASESNVEYEINDADIKYMFVADDEKIDYIKSISNKFQKVITLNKYCPKDPNFISLTELKVKGRELLNSKPDLIENLIDRVDENDVATILYTSGSTGVPKGVVLSHKNLISQVVLINKTISSSTADKAVSFLPTSHIFERTISYFYMSNGISVYFTPDVKMIGEIVKEVKPSIMTVVPRFLEKVYNKMKMNVKTSPPLKKMIAGKAFRRALEKVPFSEMTFSDKIFDKLVYKKLRAALGGNFRMVVCGGSAIGDSTFVFFNNIGLPVFPGYGLTEFSPVISSNFPGSLKQGTVGKPLPEVEVKISEEGEILAKGDSVMLGYHNMPEETAKTIDKEGFLHTGDRGSIDEDGFLKITGRIKEMFKSSTGEYISPVPIEDRLTKLELYDLAMVIAEGRKYTTCLLFPDFENLNYLKKKRRLSKLSVEEFYKHPKVIKETKSYIEKINKNVNNWEKIQKFKVITKQLTIENNELTPKLNIRRGAVYKNYETEIESMYDEDNEQ